jgi:hypothetical protein
MSFPRTPMLVGMILTAALVTLPGLTGAQELELRRVMLSAGGVGYFEYEAIVEGDATLPLSVRLDQVDDVLKSIVVYDDTGAVGAIRLPGREPLSQIFRDLPFGPEALRSPVMLLNALPGAEIRATGQRQIEGRLVRVVGEQASVPDATGVVTRHRVSVMTVEGLQTFIFEDAESVMFTDPDLRSQIDTALEAVSEHRTRERRTLDIVSRGTGRRTVRVGYVVAAPLWKATYRLTLSQRASEKGQLQGWAVIENMSGRDWKDIELTIVSGNPVTFHQALYTAYYAHRPEVPVQVMGNIMPRADTGTLAIDEVALSDAPRENEFRLRQRAELGSEEMEKLEMRDASREVQIRGGRSSGVNFAVPPPSQARLVAATSKEAATQVTFRIPHAVSVTSGQSVLVPIIDREIPSGRIGLYQQSVHDRHPLSAVRLDNDGDTGLPPGVITLYETGDSGSSFVGDAQLSTLPSGEGRLVSFALDHKATIDREFESRQVIAEGRVVDGMLELTYEAEQTTVYRIKAPAHEGREILIEHPRQQDWKIVKPDPKDVELTDNFYRIRQRVGAGEQAKLTVEMTRPLSETIALIDRDEDFYLAYAGNGELDDDLRESFREMARLRALAEMHELKLQELEGARVRLYEDQRRIRDNLSRIPGGIDLQRRYLEKLNEQEDELEAIFEETEETRDALDTATAALTDYIRDLEL